MKTMRRADIALRAVVLLAPLALCSVSRGQSADKGAGNATGLEEIVVTATRREERLEDVPVSVTAFSQEKLDAQGVRNIDDLTRLTPGVSFLRNGLAENYNDQASDIAIRGIDSSAGAATTGIYVDDTPIQSRKIGFGTQNAYPALFDLERIEVLRGPQGTLFGAGSEGGTVRFITPQPGLQNYSGYVRSEVASTRRGDPTAELGGAIGGPIIADKLGFRASVSYRRDGGYVDRVDYRTLRVVEPKSNWDETVTARLALKWAVSESVSITPSIYYQQLKTHDTGAYWSQSPNLSNPSSGDFKNGNALTNPSIDPFLLAAIRLDWNLGWAQLTETTSYFKRDQHSISDYTQFDGAVLLGTSLRPYGDAAPVYFTDKQKNFYEEIRLQSADDAARFNWTAGVFYAHLDENSEEYIYDPNINAELGGTFCTVDLPCPNGLIYYQPYFRVIDKQLAGFGEVNFKFTDTLKATVGLRVAKADFTGSGFFSGPFNGPPITDFHSSSEKPVTPKAVLSWQPDRDDLFYLSAAKGYRVGGTNTSVGPSCDPSLAAAGVPPGPDGVRRVPSVYSSDSLWSYEIGAKNTLLNHRLQINSSVFLIDWKGIQQNVYLPSCGSQYADNLGQVRSVGGDINLLFKPVENLMLDFTAAYNDAKYTRNSSRIPGAAPIVSKGDGLRGAPWSFMFATEYSLTTGMTYKPYVRLDYQYSTAQTRLLPGQNSNNGLNDVTIPSLPLARDLSLRGGLRWSGYDVSLFVQNLTNSFPMLYRSRDISIPNSLYFDRSVRPRTIGLTATYRY